MEHTPGGPPVSFQRFPIVRSPAPHKKLSYVRKYSQNNLLSTNQFCDFSVKNPAEASSTRRPGGLSITQPTKRLANRPTVDYLTKAVYLADLLSITHPPLDRSPHPRIPRHGGGIGPAGISILYTTYIIWKSSCLARVILVPVRVERWFRSAV